METTTNSIKLNLGCGTDIKEGYINVDKYGDPDLVCDLEHFPWPWVDNSVEEIQLYNVLEHLGQTTETFLAIMSELYRICAPGAIITITVPHPRHSNFINDPTHVRPITVEGMHLFSKKKNIEWQKAHAANTQLALQRGVDFEVIKEANVLEEPWRTGFESGKLTSQQLSQLSQQYNNVVRDIIIVLKAIK